jgi:hypothetical protein
MQKRLPRALPLSVLSFLLVAALAGCASLSNRPPKATDLSGDWQLNESLSDDPQALMRAHRQQMGGGYGHGMHHRGGTPEMGMPNFAPLDLNGPGDGTGNTGGTGGYGGYGGHHGGGGGGGGSGFGVHRGANNEFLARPDKMSIKQEAQELHLMADGVPTDFTYGDKVMASVHNGAAERTSGWKGKDFVVKLDVTDGPKVTRSYELSDDAKKLTLTTEVSGGGAPDIKFHSVYDRQSAG